MEEELRALLEKARNHKITPGELFEQRVSFVYSGCGDGRSKEEIRAALAAAYGDPAAYEAEITTLRAEIASRDAALVKARAWVSALYCASGCSCCRDDDGWEAASEVLAGLLDIPKYGDGSGFDFYAVRDDTAAIRALATQEQPHDV
jgi:hypothetical protein